MAEFGTFDWKAAAKDWPGCPARFLTSLNLYVDRRVSTGGFLRAVLENDLAGAIFQGDAEALEALRSIVAVVHNYVPAAACGSKAKVAAWLSPRAKE